MHKPGDPLHPLDPPPMPYDAKLPHAPQPLLLRGTVVAIVPIGTPGQHARWRVQLDVDEVLSGTCTGPNFEFMVHSPTKSGLATGQELTLSAQPEPEGGYRVDEYQWLPAAP